MAKPLDERILAALGPGARLATVSDLISELRSAIASAQREHDTLDQTAKSATSSELDAEAAAEECGRVGRRLVRMRSKMEQLEARHTELMNSDRRRRNIEQYEAIRQRRDQLAEDLRQRWPVLMAEMVGLIERIEASDAEIEATRADVPSGCEWLASAEAVARDCSPTWQLPGGGGPVLRFTKIKLPTLDGRDTLRPDRRAERAERARLVEQQQRRAREEFEALQAEEARFSRFMVTPPATRQGNTLTLECRTGTVHCTKPGLLVMTEEQVAAAKAKGCEVSPVAADAVYGMMPSASF